MGSRIPGGYEQVADLCQAEQKINESLSLMKGITNTIKLPAEALTLMLRVVFVLVDALSAIQRARAVIKTKTPTMSDSDPSVTRQG